MPQGAAVTWVQMGRGNVEFERYRDISDRGKAWKHESWETADEGERQRVALEESLRGIRATLNGGS